MEFVRRLADYWRTRSGSMIAEKVDERRKGVEWVISIKVIYSGTFSGFGMAFSCLGWSRLMLFAVFLLSRVL